MSIGTFSLLNGNHTLFVDFAHRLSDQFTDVVIVVCRDGSHLLNLADITTDLLALFAQILDNSSNRFVNTAFQIHRICTGSYVLNAYTYDSLSQYGCSSGTVTCIISSF